MMMIMKIVTFNLLTSDLYVAVFIIAMFIESVTDLEILTLIKVVLNDFNL